MTLPKVNSIFVQTSFSVKIDLLGRTRCYHGHCILMVGTIIKIVGHVTYNYITLHENRQMRHKGTVCLWHQNPKYDTGDRT